MADPQLPRMLISSGADTSDLPDRLPPLTVERWVPRRKAQIVAAIISGLLTVEAACRRYGLTSEEIECWRTNLDRHGTAGLRTTRIRQYRTADTIPAPITTALDRRRRRMLRERRAARVSKE